jgi:hypothetical protein
MRSSPRPSADEPLAGASAQTAARRDATLLAPAAGTLADPGVALTVAGQHVAG